MESLSEFEDKWGDLADIARSLAKKYSPNHKDTQLDFMEGFLAAVKELTAKQN